jgi:hypothetical protein
LRHHSADRQSRETEPIDAQGIEDADNVACQQVDRDSDLGRCCQPMTTKVGTNDKVINRKVGELWPPDHCAGSERMQEHNRRLPGITSKKDMVGQAIGRDEHVGPSVGFVEFLEGGLDDAYLIHGCASRLFEGAQSQRFLDHQ